MRRAISYIRILFFMPFVIAGSVSAASSGSFDKTQDTVDFLSKLVPESVANRNRNMADFCVVSKHKVKSKVIDTSKNITLKDTPSVIDAKALEHDPQEAWEANSKALTSEPRALVFRYHTSLENERRGLKPNAATSKASVTSSNYALALFDNQLVRFDPTTKKYDAVNLSEKVSKGKLTEDGEFYITPNGEKIQVGDLFRPNKSRPSLFPDVGRLHHSDVHTTSHGSYAQMPLATPAPTPLSEASRSEALANFADGIDATAGNAKLLDSSSRIATKNSSPHLFGPPSKDWSAADTVPKKWIQPPLIADAQIESGNSFQFQDVPDVMFTSSDSSSQREDSLEKGRMANLGSDSTSRLENPSWSSVSKDEALLEKPSASPETPKTSPAALLAAALTAKLSVSMPVSEKNAEPIKKRKISFPQSLLELSILQLAHHIIYRFFEAPPGALRFENVMANPARPSPVPSAPQATSLWYEWLSLAISSLVALPRKQLRKTLG